MARPKTDPPKFRRVGTTNADERIELEALRRFEHAVRRAHGTFTPKAAERMDRRAWAQLGHALCDLDELRRPSTYAARSLRQRLRPTGNLTPAIPSEMSEEEREEIAWQVAAIQEKLNAREADGSSED